MCNNTINLHAFQPLLFTSDDVNNYFFTKPSGKELEFMGYWNSVYGLLPKAVREERKPKSGRPGYALSDVLALWMLKEFFRIPTMTRTLETLNANSNLKTILNITAVPSASVISRQTKELRKAMHVKDIQDLIVSEFHKDRPVFNLSIDSTIIDAREKPEAREAKQKKKRGRKLKGSNEMKTYLEEQKKDKELIQLEESGPVNQYISTLSERCSLTGKKNSKGHMQWRIGYKAHLAVDDFGIPVASVVTGACVHDSKVAISLMRCASENCTYLYALLDGGYSSERIENFAISTGKVPIIDFQANRNGVKKEIHPPHRKRYKARTTVERTNSELKGCFLPHVLYSRGKNALFEIELSVLLITIKKIASVLRGEKQIAA